MNTHSTHKAAGMIIVILVLFVLSSTYVWARSYEGRLGPRVFVGETDLSGMHTELARRLMQNRVDDIITSGLTIVLDGEEKILPLATLVSTDLFEDVEYDVHGTIEEAFRASHGDHFLTNVFALLKQYRQPLQLDAHLTMQTEKIEASLNHLYGDREQIVVEPSYTFTPSLNGWSAEVVPGVEGIEFARAAFFETLEERLRLLQTDPIELVLLTKQPSVSDQQAETLAPVAIELVNAAPFSVKYIDPNNRHRTWFLTQRDIASMIISTQDNIGIDTEAFALFMEPISKSIDRPMQNARLEIENGRVTDFVESREGISVDIESTYETLVAYLESQETDGFTIATHIEEPHVKTEDVNNLGIREILGTGTSSYRGSPMNRRGNIQNGVDLLNGLLIAPGDTFSLINALKPFEIENGYLPELVIKGDEIKPELGGGLCQIGTTTFRAVMNSGLEINERRNHSLVVSYYNDPSNGNPGTDATLYEPAPDFKFTNNTETHVLFQAENLTETQELRFTLWGTSDGRKGSYTAPVVERWIPVGETRYVDTEDLEPGEEECQEAHIGADASFDYTVVHPDGEVETTTYESHYRPLPKICLVGVESLKEESTDETFPQE